MLDALSQSIGVGPRWVPPLLLLVSPLPVCTALLVGTHLYAFLLIPAAMYVFYSKVDELKEVRARSPFVALLGMSLMMVSELPA